MALTRIYGNLISSATFTGNIFQAQSITGDKIGLTAITGNLISAAAITGDKIASATIGSSNLTSTGVSSGSYGGTGNTVSITVDSQGRVTAAANVASASPSAATPTALGTVYGKQTTSGASPRLTALGYNAGVATTGANNVFVGVSAGEANVTGTDSIAIGYQAMKNYSGGDGLNIAIGTAALSAATTGSVYYNIAIGHEALSLNTSGYGNIAMGYRALYNNTSGRFSTAVGYAALRALQTGNDGSTAVGSDSLSNVTTGVYNVAVGGSTGGSINTGSYNTLMGYGALGGGSTSTSSNNVAIGYNAMATAGIKGSNIAIGRDAMYALTTGTYNVAIGRDALVQITDTVYNTAVGYQAGYGANTQGYNTYLGAFTGYTATAGEYNVAIGYGSGYNITTGDGNICIHDYTSRSYAIFSVTSENDRVVMGHNYITNAYIKVAWTITSDARDKTDVTPSTYGLDFVNKLKPVTFRWDERTSYENKTPDGSKKKLKTQLGFLAQDVIALEKEFGAVAKDLLVADDEQEDSLKITETKMIPVLVKAIQELKAEFDAYKLTHP